MLRPSKACKQKETTDEVNSLGHVRPYARVPRVHRADRQVTTLVRVMGITHVFEVTAPGYSSGMWFVVNQTDKGCDLWECYAWEGQDVPPTEMQQTGYRWSITGNAVHFAK